MASGLPESMIASGGGPSWLEFAQQYLDAKWARSAAKTRDALTDALATVTAALTTEGTDDGPDPSLVRTALRQFLLPPNTRTFDPTGDVADVARWLVANSLPLEQLTKARHLRRGLDALALTLDGQPSAATTVRRKRAVFHNALQYAVEIEVLPSNNLDRAGWTAPKVSDLVDRRVVINPSQARELLTAVTYVGPLDRGRHLRGFFACMYFAALRPAEVQALRAHECHLPADGWGHLTLEQSRPEANRRWSDTGDAHEPRGLKHRAATQVRRFPIPPQLVRILREHRTRCFHPSPRDHTTCGAPPFRSG